LIERGRNEMKTYDPMVVARKAMPFRFGRPAMALMHDSPDVRLMILRVPVGQAVPMHASPATVLLYVLSGCGLVSGADGDRAVHPGTVIAYEPKETHGMRAISEEMVLLAIIAPRPAKSEAMAEAAIPAAAVVSRA
jgi:quercetin dioxygenase-like cupin family protein